MNLKNGMTQYKIKLDEKKKIEKIIKLNEKIENENFTNTRYSPNKWKLETNSSCKNFILFFIKT